MLIMHSPEMANPGHTPSAPVKIQLFTKTGPMSLIALRKVDHLTFIEVP
jgi:hypothetical protein